MQSKFSFLFLSVFLLLLPLICADARVGGWQPIKDLNNAHVKEIAGFAVSEYNHQSHLNLKLDSILKGEEQVVSGFNYRLTVAVNDGGAQNKNYLATVWEKAVGEKSFQLISFVPA